MTHVTTKTWNRLFKPLNSVKDGQNVIEAPLLSLVNMIEEIAVQITELLLNARMLDIHWLVYDLQKCWDILKMSINTIVRIPIFTIAMTLTLLLELVSLISRPLATLVNGIHRCLDVGTAPQF